MGAFEELFGYGGIGGGQFSAETKQKIGLLGARIQYLEEQVEALTMAVIVLLNAKEKKSSARIPTSVRYRKPKIQIEYSPEEDGKIVASIRIELQR
jgi:hypothetical protein